MFNKAKNKRIFFIPFLITALAVVILYPFFDKNFSLLFQAISLSISAKKLIMPNGVNTKYLIFFTGLLLMSFSDTLFERINVIIPVFIMIAGIVFAYFAKTNLKLPIESLGTGAGIFILMDITKLGYYALGDVITAGAIGVYTGIEKVVIVSIFAIILGKIIFNISVKIDGVFDKSRIKQFHFAFVPVLFVVTAAIYNV